jgi:DNA-binding transcriptional LysR family regulator
MKLKHLEVFGAVMATGTLSAAARLLHITQPAATQALQAAERQLGYALFRRQKNRLVPTAEALALHPEVIKLGGQLEAVRRLAGALAHEGTQALRVMMVPSLAMVQLPQAIRRFRVRQPKLPLEIRSGHTREIVRALALREVDLGIVFGNEVAPGLVAEEVALGHLVCVTRTAPAHVTQRATQITLEDVVRMPLVRIHERDPLGALIAEHCARAGLAPRGELVVQTHHTALVLAEQGFGPAVVDSFTAAARQDPALRVLRIEPEIRVPLRALQVADAPASAAARAFTAALREVVAAQG